MEKNPVFRKRMPQPTLLPYFDKLTVIIVLFSVLFYAPANAEEIKLAPPYINGSTKVSAEKLVEAVNSIPNLLLIDARMRMDRKQGFIEGSISLPDIQTNCKTLAEVIPTKTAPVLFYCNGEKCRRSEKSVRKAVMCGYKNIYWFRGGFEEWQQKGYPSLKE